MGVTLIIYWDDDMMIWSKCGFMNAVVLNGINSSRSILNLKAIRC